MLPQPRLRFLLADDPGAGKTIMAGLLLKEMKLREAIERILILCPAPLTIQWQDELLRWFWEPFDIIFSAIDQQQLVNPWQKNAQVISSIDYAKQEDVRERVWQKRWDLIIIDEAHKCSAYTKHRANRPDAVDKTKLYQLAERLAYYTDHLLLLTATPHHGDDDRFGHFIRLIDPDIFPEPHKIGEKAGEIRRDILRLGPECPWSIRRLKEDLKDLEGRWYKATRLGDSYWLYVVWDPLENPDSKPIRIQNPAHKLDHVKREIVAAMFFEIPPDAIGYVGKYVQKRP